MYGGRINDPLENNEITTEAFVTQLNARLDSKLENAKKKLDKLKADKEFVEANKAKYEQIKNLEIEAEKLHSEIYRATHNGEDEPCDCIVEDASPDSKLGWASDEELKSLKDKYKTYEARQIEILEKLTAKENVDKLPGSVWENLVKEYKELEKIKLNSVDRVIIELLQQSGFHKKPTFACEESKSER